MESTHSAVVAFLGALHVLSLSCRGPNPPSIAPERAEIVGLGVAGMDLRLTLRIVNPNGYEMVARSVTAKVTVDGQPPLGTVVVAEPIRLPPAQETITVVPLSASWSGIASLLSVTLSQADIPYRVDGTVNVGGDRLNVDLPFHIDTRITREEIIKITLRPPPQP